jgi:hypothetical protein
LELGICFGTWIFEEQLSPWPLFFNCPASC